MPASAALWLGAMAYSLFIGAAEARPRWSAATPTRGRGRAADPRPRQPLAGGRPDRRALAHRRGAGRQPTTTATGRSSPPKPSCSPRASALFWWVSWRGWPRRVFALPDELPGAAAPVPHGGDRHARPRRRRVRAELPQLSRQSQTSSTRSRRAEQRRSWRAAARLVHRPLGAVHLVGEHHHLGPPVAQVGRAAARSASVDRRHHAGLRHVVEQLGGRPGHRADPAACRPGRRGRGRSRPGCANSPCRCASAYACQRCPSGSTSR